MKKGACLTVVSAMLLLVMSATSLTLAGTEIGIDGTVRGRDGAPKRFATVQLEGPRRYLVTTNANGEFRIAGVLPGQYTARVRQGDNVATFSVQISTDRLDLIVNW